MHGGTVDRVGGGTALQPLYCAYKTNLSNLKVETYTFSSTTLIYKQQCRQQLLSEVALPA